MSNYTKLTDFAAKDALATGNANKIVKGTEIDDEFQAIETAIATKANAANATLTGTPTAPTATPATSSTQIATTAFVQTVAADAVSSGIDNPSSDIVINSVQMGDWTITVSGTELVFAYQATDVFKLESTGAVTSADDVTAFGTV